jgi:hypothetical protein
MCPLASIRRAEDNAWTTQRSIETRLQQRTFRASLPHRDRSCRPYLIRSRSRQSLVAPPMRRPRLTRSFPPEVARLPGPRYLICTSVQICPLGRALEVARPRRCRLGRLSSRPPPLPHQALSTQAILPPHRRRFNLERQAYLRRIPPLSAYRRKDTPVAHQCHCILALPRPRFLAGARRSRPHIRRIQRIPAPHQCHLYHL